MALGRLNARGGGTGSSDAGAHRLTAVIATIIERHYRAAYHCLDYGGLGVSDAFRELQAEADTLDGLDPDALAGLDARLAFWLNAYNALVLHAVCASRASGSIREIRAFFSDPSYGIGGQRLTLDEIEHGILRGNARRPFGLQAVLGRHDPRLAWIMAEPDPRVHFGMYTASRSSPPLQAFAAPTVRAQLDAAARDYLDRWARVDAARGVLTLPKTFHWYAADFGGEATIAEWVANRLPAADPRREAIENASGAVRYRYIEYDWSLNDCFAPST